MTTKETTPRFSTAASTGQTLSSESFRGKVPIAMVLLPQADASADALARYNVAHVDLAPRRVQLLAVLPVTASSARQLADRAQLTFPILSDPSLAIFREFGATDEADEPDACSVIIDRTGTVASITQGVVSPEEMTAQLDDLERSSRFEMAVNR